MAALMVHNDSDVEGVALLARRAAPRLGLLLGPAHEGKGVTQ
jgi:hypothetical protein